MAIFLKYIHKLLIFSLIIIIFYNIFFILILLFNQKIDGFLLKSWNYSPYNYSELFTKTAGYSKKQLRIKNNTSKRLFNLMVASENKSALDYYYWNNKTLYLISKKEFFDDFEKSFQNSVILSKNNLRQKKTLKLFYLKNIPRFSEETRNIIMSN
tara:strand:+ start:601 stop:1065 length:465 start_codon:yes stop_codon:yes gene_type:complete